jgi:hypothetical protein
VKYVIWQVNFSKLLLAICTYVHVMLLHLLSKNKTTIGEVWHEDLFSISTPQFNVHSREIKRPFMNAFPFPRGT